MLYRCLTGVTILTIGSMLLAGCASSSRSGTAATGKPGPSGKQVAEAEPEEVDPKVVSAHAHYIQGVMHDVSDESDEALKEFSLAVEADPSNEELALDLSRRYLQRRQLEEALKPLQRASEVPGASGAIFAQLGLVYSRLGKDAEALEASQKAVKRSPSMLAGYRNLFLIHLQKGRTAEALAVLDQASKQPDVKADFLADLAELYVTLGRQTPALKEPALQGSKAALKRGADQNPSNPQVQLRLADGFNVAGEATNAARLYLQLLDKYGELPALRDEVRTKLMEMYLRSNEPQKAMEQLEAIVRDDPANAQAYYTLGLLAYDAKKLPEAEDYFQKALLLKDDVEGVYLELAEVQINLDHGEGALNTLQKARAKFPNSFLGEFLSGLAYSRTKDFTNAVIHYTSAELLGKASGTKLLNADFYFQVGSSYERKGDYPQAEQYFEKALKLSPDFPEALNYFGYMLADRGEELPRARQMIERAVQIEPKNAAYLDSLGWVLYKLNQPGEALPQVLKAIELSGEPDATLYDHLGDIYAALKQPDKAREAWQNSLKVEPNEQVKKKIAPVMEKARTEDFEKPK